MEVPATSSGQNRATPRLWVDGAEPARHAEPASKAVPYNEYMEVMRTRVLFTTGQIAKICGVAPRTVSKWIDAGKLTGYRIPLSNDRRVSRESLVRFMREHSMPVLKFLAPAPLVAVYAVRPDLQAAWCGMVTSHRGGQVDVCQDFAQLAATLASENHIAVLVDGDVSRGEVVAAAKMCEALSNRPFLLGAGGAETTPAELLRLGCRAAEAWPEGGDRLAAWAERLTRE